MSRAEPRNQLPEGRNQHQSGDDHVRNENALIISERIATTHLNTTRGSGRQTSKSTAEKPLFQANATIYVKIPLRLVERKDRTAWSHDRSRSPTVQILFLSHEQRRTTMRSHQCDRHYAVRLYTLACPSQITVTTRVTGPIS